MYPDNKYQVISDSEAKQFLSERHVQSSRDTISVGLVAVTKILIRTHEAKRLVDRDPSSRQRGRPTPTKPQLSDGNKKLVLGSQKGLDTKTGRLTVGRNVTLTLDVP
jgi:hypothetical protein